MDSLVTHVLSMEENMKCILVETLQKLKNLKELKIYEASDVSLPKKKFWSLEISYGVGDNFF